MSLGFVMDVTECRNWIFVTVQISLVKVGTIRVIIGIYDKFIAMVQ